MVIGGTIGLAVPPNLLPVVADPITITGLIVGTRNDLEDVRR